MKVHIYSRSKTRIRIYVYGCAKLRTVTTDVRVRPASGDVAGGVEVDSVGRGEVTGSAPVVDGDAERVRVAVAEGELRKEYIRALEDERRSYWKQV